MRILEKWKKKIAEAENGEDFVHILEQMENEHYKKYCLKMPMNCYPPSECNECKAYWLDRETENEE